MISNQSISLFWIKRVALLIFVFGLLVSILRFILVPGVRTGPFGFGIPAQMTTYEGKLFPFSFQYPESWVVSETPEGNHGDLDIITTILVPGRSWPKVVIEKIDLTHEDVEGPANYEEGKIKKGKNIVQITLDQFKTTNLNGLIREYTWRTNSWIIENLVVRCNDYYVKQNSLGYTISFCAEQINGQRSKAQLTKL